MDGWMGLADPAVGLLGVDRLFSIGVAVWHRAEGAGAIRRRRPDRVCA